MCTFVHSVAFCNSSVEQFPLNQYSCALRDTLPWNIFAPNHFLMLHFATPHIAFCNTIAFCNIIKEPFKHSALQQSSTFSVEQSAWNTHLWNTFRGILFRCSAVFLGDHSATRPLRLFGIPILRQMSKSAFHYLGTQALDQSTICNLHLFFRLFVYSHNRLFVLSSSRRLG